jgi:hypothetical protein
MIVKEASKPEPIISNTFELRDEYDDDYEMALEFNDILTMSSDHDSLLQMTQARSITPKNDVFYEQQWGEFYIGPKEIPIMESDTQSIQSFETVIQWKETTNNGEGIQLQGNNDQLINDLQSIGISTITVEDNIPTQMIIEPIISQTQIQIQTPELPKHEFINRKIGRRASMSDIQLNPQQQQIENVINNYNQMLSEMANNYNSQIYQIIWNNTNTVESMNLYIKDLENRLSDLNNKEDKFDELTNVQATRINELEQIIEKLTQLNEKREMALENQQQNINILENSINNYRIEQVYYEQWKESQDSEKSRNSHTMKGLQIEIEDYKERLVNYSKIIKDLQDLKETVNMQDVCITNLKYDKSTLEKERLTLKNNLEKSIQELQEAKNNQPVMEISQGSNEIPIMESDQGSQTDGEEIPKEEGSLKGITPIMRVYKEKESNKKGRKRKAVEIIPRIVRKIIKRK